MSDTLLEHSTFLMSKGFKPMTFKTFVYNTTPIPLELVVLANLLAYLLILRIFGLFRQCKVQDIVFTFSVNDYTADLTQLQESNSLDWHLYLV